MQNFSGFVQDNQRVSARFEVYWHWSECQQLTSFLAKQRHSFSRELDACITQGLTGFASNDTHDVPLPHGSSYFKLVR
jgi:hypothetical protein